MPLARYRSSGHGVNDIGSAVTRNARDRTRNPECLYGYGLGTDAKKAQHAGFAYHMLKPVDMDSLLAVLSNIPGSPAKVC